MNKLGIVCAQLQMVCRFWVEVVRYCPAIRGFAVGVEGAKWACNIGVKDGMDCPVIWRRRVVDSEGRSKERVNCCGFCHEGSQYQCLSTDAMLIASHLIPSALLSRFPSQG